MPDLKMVCRLAHRRRAQQARKEPTMKMVRGAVSDQLQLLETICATGV
jgi:hypothetical protein